MRTAAIVPALNEAETIADLVVALKAQPLHEVIVVDNGSIDSTGALAMSKGATVVAEPREGYGYACAAGARAATADILVFIDADFSAQPAYTSHLTAPILSSDAQLVLGSRMLGTLQPGAMPPHQRFGNWIIAQLMSRLYHVSVTDLSPFRAIRRDLLFRLAMREMTYGWPTEMMVKCARMGISLVEVPVPWHVRRGGRSKIGGTIKGSALAAYYISFVTMRYLRWRPTTD